MLPATKFVVVTGCNGVGKSTVAQALRERHNATVFHYPAEFVQFREQVRLDTVVPPLPRLLYYLGATLHLSDMVRRQLAQTHVVCDRYLESPVSLLIADSAFTEEELDRLCAPFLPALAVPDATLLLTATHEVACRRIRERLPHRRTRVEQLVLDSPEFFHRREAALRTRLARQRPVIELDTTGLSLTEMCDAGLSAAGSVLAH